MSCHLVGRTADAEIPIADEIHFRGVRRVRGELGPQPSGTWSLCAARIDCQLGTGPRTGRECLACTRLLSWEAGPNPGEVTVACLWTHFDPVAARMTGRDALVCVAPTVTCRDADRLAAREGVHRLLVVDRQHLVGIVCRHDLEPAPSEPVALHMRSRVYVVAAAATIGEAAAAMQALDVGCLPVMRSGILVGIITRGDLLRCGLPKELLAP